MDAGTLLDAARSRSGLFVERLREIVSIDSGTYSPDGVNRVVDALAGWFGEGGWEVERRPAPDGLTLGDLLIGRIEGHGSHRVLVVIHTDTVFPDGTADARPFRVEDGRGLGPGVSDAKAGLLAGMEAVEALRATGSDTYASVTFACNPDEEVGSPFSGPHIRELATQADVAFVLEAGRENGDIVAARKGVVSIRAELRGRAAHAGVEPERGRHAVLAGAMKTLEIQRLNGWLFGATFNVGVLQGGTRPNVVPDACSLEIDVRAFDDETLAEAKRRVMEILDKEDVPDVTTHVEIADEHHAMSRSESTDRLVALAKEIAGELGFGLDGASTGGVSDANGIAGVGTPVLDGLGPVGGDDHGPAEWVDLATAPERIALLAGLIARAGEIPA